MNEYRFTISLRIFTKMIDPKVICEEIGYQPEILNKMGEVRTTPTGMPLTGTYSETYISFPQDRLNDETLPEMIERICNSLYPKREIFRRIHDTKGSSELFIGWFLSGNAGEVFSSDLLRKLGETYIALSFDVYPPRTILDTHEIQ